VERAPERRDEEEKAADTGDTGPLDETADTGDSADTAAGLPCVLPPAAEVDTAAGPPTVVYAVRHAEKGTGDDPGLTAEGLARADALVGLLHEVPLAAVYATDLVRTQQTVAPTAADHGLTVVIDYDPEEELAAHILLENAGTSVLHAGHSYTLDDFMEALGVADPPSTSDYGDVWILTVAAGGGVTLQTTCFGE